ncbi:MAG: glycogen synthase GlgA, partial [Candidatus Acidiferrales bacterium]
FSKTGGLADVIGALPKALAARGHDVTVFLPRYRATESGLVAYSSVEVRLGAKAFKVDIQGGRVLDAVRYYFLDYPPFFDREELYTLKGADYPDNAERFALFSRAALAFLERAGAPDLIHCHDWQSALIPVILKSAPAAGAPLAGVPVVFTVHNQAYQGVFPREVLERVGLAPELFSVDGLEFYGQVNFLKGGLLFSDFITTVSKKYAEEIQTPEYGHGLDGAVRDRAGSLAGILNGVDYSEWSPETDRFIAANYSAANFNAKQVCKKDLLRQFGLRDTDLRRPLLGIVSRFATQKGFDLIEEVAESLLENDLFFVALGTGEPRFEEMFRRLAERHPTRVGVRVGFDNALAHKIEAGSDMFLMPSRWEPCGLNQIYSLRYGTVPVVRATGGLDDTVEPFDLASGRGTGFKFAPYTGAAFLECVQEALAVFQRHPQSWRRLMKSGMARDFSWDRSAAEYEALFQRVVKSARGE